MWTGQAHLKAGAGHSRACLFSRCLFRAAYFSLVPFHVPGAFPNRFVWEVTLLEGHPTSNQRQCKGRGDIPGFRTGAIDALSHPAGNPLKKGRASESSK